MNVCNTKTRYKMTISRIIEEMKNKSFLFEKYQKRKTDHMLAFCAYLKTRILLSHGNEPQNIQKIYPLRARIHSEDDITTKLISKLIMAHIAAVRLLNIRIFETNFRGHYRNIRREGFIWTREAIKDIICRKFLFVCHHGRFLNYLEIYSFAAKISIS